MNDTKHKSFMGYSARVATLPVPTMRDNPIQRSERWAVHHASKPKQPIEEVLSVIAHYPPIKKITRSYTDGKVPETFDPYAEIEWLKAALAEALEGAFWQGWCEAAEWANRDDLLADRDSDAYANAMKRRLAAMVEAVKEWTYHPGVSAESDAP